jgi:ABC-type multidrug transport system permease subunit
MQQVSVIVPQGWALKAMNLTLSGALPQDVLLPVMVMLVFGILFFAFGARMFSKRFS